MIPFNKPPYTSIEDEFVRKSIHSSKISGDGHFTKMCSEWFEKKLNCKKALLTTSCTHALEMAAILLDIQEGDEVIMPSYTFVSTANAFVLRGAKVVFVDIRSDTMNIDETKIEAAISDKTKVIVPVHYAGVACEMDTIMDIANRYNLFVVEDAAQGMMSLYKEKPLGTIGHIGAFSFHETKNYTSAGEGGLLIINDKRFVERAEIIREKGTNRSQFFRGVMDKYTWVDVGSSYLMNDVSAAYLWGNIQSVNDIKYDRLSSWHRYYKHLIHLQDQGKIVLPVIPNSCEQNGHMFYIKVRGLEQRTELISYLIKNQICAVFHYVPLHSSVFGKKHTIFYGKDEFTTVESDRLVRLPMYYGLSEREIDYICEKIKGFFE